MRSLDVTWRPDLKWPGSKIFTTCAKKMYAGLGNPSYFHTPVGSRYRFIVPSIVAKSAFLSSVDHKEKYNKNIKIRTFSKKRYHRSVISSANMNKTSVKPTQLKTSALCSILWRIWPLFVAVSSVAVSLIPHTLSRVAKGICYAFLCAIFLINIAKRNFIICEILQRHIYETKQIGIGNCSMINKNTKSINSFCPWQL